MKMLTNTPMEQILCKEWNIIRKTPEMASGTAKDAMQFILFPETIRPMNTQVILKLDFELSVFLDKGFNGLSCLRA